MKLDNHSKEIVGDKVQIEQVQKEKQEYKLIDSFIRTRGLNLYGYDHRKDEVYLVQEDDNDTIHWDDAQNLTRKYTASVDSRHTFFEALNINSANKRVQKYKAGKKELCNLKFSDGTINFYN